MKRLSSKVAPIFALIAIFIMLLCKTCLGFEDGDFQYWTTASASSKINEDWKVKLEEEFRFGDDAGDFYYQHSDLGATYSGLADWLDLGTNYRFIFEEKSGSWKYENRPHLNGTLKFNLYGFDFSDRHRFEYRDKEEGNDGWRYRDKFTVKFPIEWTKFKIRPYMANEIFYDFDEDKLNRNRLYGGITLKLLKNLKGDIYYLWQSTKGRDEWTDYNVFGTKIKLSF